LCHGGLARSPPHLVVHTEPGAPDKGRHLSAVNDRAKVEAGKGGERESSGNRAFKDDAFSLFVGYELIRTTTEVKL
jgi:hypothetical protein